MLERRLLLAILLVLVLGETHLLNLSITKTSAVISPYIGVVPASTVNPTLTPGTNYTISIYTDYTGSDVIGYGFELTYNPEVLEGLEVVNGDLITEDVAPIIFYSVGFDNTAGRLRYTNNGFFFLDEPAPTTSGPGTLANVTFRIIAKGTANLTLETQGGYRTRLIGYTEDGYGDFYNIIDSETDLDHIQHGFFDNRLPHDVAVVNVTAQAEATIGSVVSISVEVANIGKSAEVANVSVFYDSTLIGFNDTVVIPAENSVIVPFSWNTTGLAQGTYTVNATATISDDGDLSDNWDTTTIFLAEHDVAVVSVTAQAEATVGSVVSISVEVENVGKSDEDVEVTVSYDTTQIDSQNVTLLVGENKTVLFSWNTTGVAQGVHTVNATATISDDGDLSDNWNTTTILLAMHDVAITYISVQPATVYVGDLATIIVQVANLGWYNETFQVEITYDTTIIEEPKSVDVLSGNSLYTQFSWNTTSVEPSSYTITAKAILETDINSTNNLMTKSIVINPPSPGAIAGTVTDASTGEPIVGASVTADGYTATTDIQGHYNITDVPVGTFNVTIEATGYSSDFKLASVESQKTTTVNFTLRVISTISISADPTTITVGKSTTLSGSIDPIYQSVTVTIWYRLSGEGLWSNLATVTTNQDSQYSYVWTPETSGTYEIKASWLGDENTLPDESDAVVIIVEDTEAPDILPYVAAAALGVIILAIIVYYLLRIKKSK